MNGMSQGVLREYWLDLPGTSISDLVTASAYPDHPSGTNLVSSFEAPSNWMDNYGTRLRGYVQAPQTGPYNFWISGDDQCELYLSSDEQPANKVLIASVQSWTNPRQWDKETNQQSGTISLVAAKKYYIEALQKEGGGGDCLAVGWKLPNQVLERPIPSQRLSPYRVITSMPMILQQPVDQVVEEGLPAQFNCIVEGLEPLEFQWYRDSQALPGEADPNLLLAKTELADDGAVFHCLITNAMGQTNSASAVLHVLPEREAPALRSILPPPKATVSQLSSVEVVFSEPVQGVDREDLRLNGEPARQVIGFGAGPYVFSFSPLESGMAELSWKSGHQITDLSASSNLFQESGWWIQVQSDWPRPEVRINELMALNLDAKGLKDEDGELQPWIELFNAGKTAVDLAGWSLSDDLKQPGKWVFPEWSLQPGEYRIVLASGKSRTEIDSGRLHTNFKLNPSGEFLGLFDPELPRRPISQISPAYPEQRANISYGLNREGAWAYMAPATPGQINQESLLTQVLPQVHFSVGHGCFTHPFNLQLSSEDNEAAIRYTLDGSEPTESTGLIYSEPIPLSKTSMVRAAAFKSNSLPSRVVTQTYLFNLSSAMSSLPILSLVTAQDNLLGPAGIMGINGGKYVDGAWVKVNPGDYHNPSKHGLAWERPVSAELIHSDGQEGFTEDCGIRIHSSVWFRPRLQPTSKFSYRLYFRGEYGAKKLNYSWFTDSPVQSFDQIVIRAGNNDQKNPFITDELVRRLSIDTGQAGLHGTFVNLFVNGQYKGYYNPTERVTPDFCQTWYGSTNDWDVIAQQSEAMDGDSRAWNSLRQLAASKSLTNRENYLAVARQLDLTNFVDYLLVNIYAATGDWPNNNWRAARERSSSGLFRFYIWDAEHAFGLYDISRASRNVFANELSGSSEIPTFYKNLKKSREFRLFFADRIQKHFFNEGALTDTNVLNRYNECKAALISLIPQMNANIPRTWIPTRRTAVFKHFQSEGVWPGPAFPVFSQHGGLVAPGYQLRMEATNTILFTTNGSDPRQMFTGQVSAEARIYQEPLSMSTGGTVKARALNGTNWSALTEATFNIPALSHPVRFSEIMYHPPGGDAYEFVELLNLSSSRIDLSGIRLVGADFTFPAGSFVSPQARLILCSDIDPAAFQARYPECEVSGYFHGTLSNGGETLALVAPNGDTLTSVTYVDQLPWPQAADGKGASLEIIDPLGHSSDPANWRASRRAGGTPGDPPPLAPSSPIVIHEIMAAPNGSSASDLVSADSDSIQSDWIELANLSSNRVSLADWRLSDGSHQFVFPFDTWIEAKGYLLVYGDSGKGGSILQAGFGLNRHGETLLLIDPELDIADAVSFGPQVPGFSSGVSSNGWDLNTPTPGQPNRSAAPAAPESICINEWLVNSAPEESDWIEYYNRDLSRPARLSGLLLWVNQEMAGFWPLTFIPPGGYLLIRANGVAHPDSIPLNLPARGGQIKLMTANGKIIDVTSFGSQLESVSQGRSPDGAAQIVTFGQRPSPGLPNESLPYSGPVLNEILACPADEKPAFIELHSPLPNPVDISGYQLRFQQGNAEWTYPLPTSKSMDGGGYWTALLSELFPGSAAVASNETKSSALLNPAALANGGTIELVSVEGQIVDRVSFGTQAAGYSIGPGANGWRLLTRPTPDAANAGPATVNGAGSIRINECLALNSSGHDWIELYNGSAIIADLSGARLSDDPSLAGQTKALLPPLSFVAPYSFVVYQADSDPAGGPTHLPFRLNGLGESLFLYSATGSLIDSIDSPPALTDISFGRYPDGTGPTRTFPESATPGRSNLPSDLDQDRDGMPDYWELAHHLDPLNPADGQLDSDHDGFLNIYEFTARTDPQDGTIKLAFDTTSIQGTRILLRFLAQKGRAYTIEYSDLPQERAWSRLVEISPRTESGWVNVEVILDTAAPQRFYRISCR